MITSVHDHLRFAQHKRGWECTLSASSSLAVLHALQPCSHPPSTLCRIVPSNQAQAHALRGIVSTNHAQPYTLGRLEIPTCYRGRILVGGPPCMVPKNLWPTGSKRRHPANGAEWVPVQLTAGRKLCRVCVCERERERARGEGQERLHEEEELNKMGMVR